MLHPFGVASRDDFGKKTVDQNDTGALTLTGGSRTLEPSSGRSCAEFRMKFSKLLRPYGRGDVTGQSCSTADELDFKVASFTLGS